MEGREAMTMPGHTPYFMQRGLPASGSGWQQPGLHPHTDVRQPVSSPTQTLPLHSPNAGAAGGGSASPAFQSDSQSPISSQGGGSLTPGLQGAGGQTREQVKKKRGRPRKYGPDGAVSLALSPLSSTPGSGPGSGSLTGSPSGSNMQPQKRRGRPPGSGRKQQLAAYGPWMSSSAGAGFTPHVITMTTGEDIATKIMSFSQQGPRAVCILSASGSVSTVTLRQPASSGGTVTYEGRFEILSLSGSYFLSDDGASRTRSGGLSISLSSPDGRVIGGGVGGLLIAASPVQVIVGSFVYGGSKPKKKPIPTPLLEAPPAEPETSLGDTRMSSPTAAQPIQSVSPPVMSSWAESRPIDVRTSHFDIDLTRG